MISIFIPMKRAKDKTEKWCVSVFQTLCLVSDQSWLCFFRFHSNLWFAAFSQSERCVPDIAPCSSSSVFPQHRVCIEQSTESAKCSDCSAAEPSQSIGGRTFCGWKDGNSRVSEHLPNVATRFQQHRWQPSLNSTDNERWKTFVEKSEQGPLLGEMRQIKTDTWCNWPKESSEPKVGRRKVSQGGNWVKGVWMSLSEQSKERESLLEQSYGESGEASLLGSAGGTLPGETGCARKEQVEKVWTSLFTFPLFLLSRKTCLEFISISLLFTLWMN